MQCMQKKKILGVIFTNNKGNKGNPADLDDNWKCLLHKVSYLIGHWNQRYLSLTGKTILVKVYSCNNLHI